MGRPPRPKRAWQHAAGPNPGGAAGCRFPRYDRAPSWEPQCRRLHLPLPPEPVEYDRARSRRVRAGRQAGAHRRRPERQDTGGSQPHDRTEPRRALPAARIRFRVLRARTAPAGGRRLLRTRAGRGRREGAIRDYMEAHPTSAVLVVEVSNESLRYDRQSSSACTRGAGFPITGSSPSPRPVSSSTATRLETATRASPTIQPGIR